MSIGSSQPPRKGVPPNERILVSEDEACELMSVSKPTLRGWVEDGILTPVELPHGIRRRLYRRLDLEAWAATLEKAQ